MEHTSLLRNQPSYKYFQTLLILITDKIPFVQLCVVLCCLTALGLPKIEALGSLPVWVSQSQSPVSSSEVLPPPNSLGLCQGPCIRPHLEKYSPIFSSLPVSRTFSLDTHKDTHRHTHFRELRLPQKAQREAVLLSLAWLSVAKPGAVGRTASCGQPQWLQECKPCLRFQDSEYKP